MKVIDYLVKVANKEADNISIKTNDYFDEFFGNCRFQYIEDGLNSEVEIIEEEKLVSIPESEYLKWLDLKTLGNKPCEEETPIISKLYINNELQYDLEEEKKIPEKINNSYYHLSQDQQNQLFKNTINEIIGYLDYLKSKGE